MKSGIGTPTLSRETLVCSPRQSCASVHGPGLCANQHQLDKHRETKLCSKDGRG